MRTFPVSSISFVWLVVLPLVQGGRMVGRLLLSTTSNVPLLWDPSALKPLLSPTWGHVSPCHWILYPCVCVHKYIYINFVQKASLAVIAATHVCVVSVSCVSC